MAGVAARRLRLRGHRHLRRDSMCSTSCPVHIDTGALVKETMVAAPSAAQRRWARADRRSLRLGAEGRRAWGWPRRAACGASPAAAGCVDRRQRASPCPGAGAPAPSARGHAAAGSARTAARPAPPTVASPVAATGESVVYFPSCLVADDRPAAGRGRARHAAGHGGRAAAGGLRGRLPGRHRRTSAAGCRSRARRSRRRRRAARRRRRRPCGRRRGEGRAHRSSPTPRPARARCASWPRRAPPARPDARCGSRTSRPSGPATSFRGWTAGSGGGAARCCTRPARS